MRVNLTRWEVRMAATIGVERNINAIVHNWEHRAGYVGPA